MPTSVPFLGPLIHCLLFWSWDIPVPFFRGSCRHAPQPSRFPSRWWDPPLGPLEGLTTACCESRSGSFLPTCSGLSHPRGGACGVRAGFFLHQGSLCAFSYAAEHNLRHIISPPGLWFPPLKWGAVALFPSRTCCEAVGDTMSC